MFIFIDHNFDDLHYKLRFYYLIRRENVLYKAFSLIDNVSIIGLSYGSLDYVTGDCR